MYECHVKLVLYSATVAPTELFEPAAQLAAAVAAAAQRALDKNATDAAAGSSGVAASKDDDDDDASLLKQHHDEVFAFARTASRLQEMASQTYLQQQRRQCNLDHHSPESERP
jgi:predicted ATPase